MCGIAGYFGRKSAAQILINGLKRLEYYGYDSAGLATLDQRQIHSIKHQSKISDLVQSLEE